MLTASPTRTCGLFTLNSPSRGHVSNHAQTSFTPVWEAETPAWSSPLDDPHPPMPAQIVCDEACAHPPEKVGTTKLPLTLLNPLMMSMRPDQLFDWRLVLSCVVSHGDVKAARGCSARSQVAVQSRRAVASDG